MSESQEPSGTPRRVAPEGAQGYTEGTDDQLHDLDVYEALIDIDGHQRRDERGGGRGAMPPAAAGGQGSAQAGTAGASPGGAGASGGGGTGGPGPGGMTGVSAAGTTSSSVVSASSLAARGGGASGAATAAGVRPSTQVGDLRGGGGTAAPGQAGIYSTTAAGGVQHSAGGVTPGVSAGMGGSGISGGHVVGSGTIAAGGGNSATTGGGYPSGTVYPSTPGYTTGVASPGSGGTSGGSQVGVGAVPAALTFGNVGGATGSGQLTSGSAGYAASASGGTYQPGAGNNMSASPSSIESQANRWEDWAARMGEINSAVAEAQADSSEFGMVSMPAAAYSNSQQSAATWTGDATAQFNEFANQLQGTAGDYRATEADNTTAVVRKLR